MTLVKFHGWSCLVQKRQYGNGNLALLLVDAETGEPIAKATLNPWEDVVLAADEIVVKDYSENEGMLEALTAAGIVEQTGRCVPLPYGNEASICRVLI